MLFNRSLEDRIQKAKESKEELNRLIQEYKPFIASLLQKKTGKYLQYGYDDELSIGMIAFEEAVESYDRNKGKFLSFC
ncbi:sigma factor [Clostridium acetobutylicum]|uniref:sigma factor n=1 Tax=Clostridium acetobutylicum TaxID=1488 RepID=UPI0017C16BD0|nr:sigma factor [Clostridium acetobutylicum]NYC94378.1 RNA polymerase sigma-I factor [Clostridium acetobutylicum]